MQKVVVFGVGQYYKKHINELRFAFSQDELVAFLDNRASEDGYFEGKRVYSPEAIHSLVYDKILLMSNLYSWEMKNQLLALGVPEENIEFGWQYICEKFHGVIQLHVANLLPMKKKRILIISYDLNYGGGTLAAVYAASSLRSLGYDVCIATRTADLRLVEDIISNGVHVITCPAIPCLGKEELYWILQFDMVIVNVFQMIRVASEVSKYKPVLWWLHESSNKHSDIYDRYRHWFPEYDNTQWMSRLRIYAVSEIAKKNFEEYYPNMVNGILPYGIPDENELLYQQTGKTLRKKIIFAIIGSISKLKAQDVFLKAARNLMEEYEDQTEFWLIGRVCQNASVNEVRNLAEEVPGVKMLGEMTHPELNDAFKLIDVVVCASLEETMSMAITEGMMHGKVCITTDATGMAKYIKNRENGLICKAGSADSLHEVMLWALEHKAELPSIREKARETYEKEFSMRQFASRLSEVIKKTLQDAR